MGIYSTVFRIIDEGSLTLCNCGGEGKIIGVTDNSDDNNSDDNGTDSGNDNNNNNNSMEIDSGNSDAEKKRKAAQFGSKNWDSDKNGHWRYCTVCEYASDKSEHNYAGANWDSNEDGHWRYCIVCGYKSASEHSCNIKIWIYTDDSHWHECDVCEYKIGKSEHHFDDGVITKEATLTEHGIITYTCMDCAYTKNEEYEITNDDNPSETSNSTDNDVPPAEPNEPAVMKNKPCKCIIPKNKRIIKT